MMLLSILLQMVIFFLLSVVIALSFAGGLYVFSKRKRKRKVIFGLTSPFFLCSVSISYVLLVVLSVQQYLRQVVGWTATGIPNCLTVM